MRGHISVGKMRKMHTVLNDRILKSESEGSWKEFHSWRKSPSCKKSQGRELRVNMTKGNQINKLYANPIITRKDQNEQ